MVALGRLESERVPPAQNHPTILLWGTQTRACRKVGACRASMNIANFDWGPSGKCFDHGGKMVWIDGSD